jgi:DNA-binding response OmpR family regulator
MLINRQDSFASALAYTYRPAQDGVSATKQGASLRIAVLEDDPSQAELLIHWLRLAGHQPRQFARGIDLVVSAQNETFDVLLLDWNVPGLSGMDVVQRVRQRLKSDVPILFVTARSDEQDVVDALREGADDYIVKPPNRLELIARLDAVMRRAANTQPAEAPAVEMGRLRLDHASRRITVNGKVPDLSAKDFDLASLLLCNVGRLLSRREIVQAVWGSNDMISSRTIDTHVSRVRNKLGLMPRNGWLLKSVYGHGYRLEQVSRDARVGEAA